MSWIVKPSSVLLLVGCCDVNVVCGVVGFFCFLVFVLSP